MNKCDVCGKETETMVCSSSCGGVSFAYCRECLNAGREPYDALVGMGLYCADINQTYKEQILMPSLQFHGKTIEEFDADVEAQDEDYRKWCEEHKAETNEEDGDFDA